MSQPIVAASPATPTTRPYAPSWLHLFVSWFERLPGPTWVAYLALVVVNTLFWHLIPWSKGTVPVGTPDAASGFWGVLAPALLGISAYLERGAATAFDAFRPVLTVPSAEAEGMRYALVVVPARPALVLTAVAAVLTAGAVLSDPVTYSIGVPVPLIVLEFAIQTVQAAILFQLLYRLVRQMTLVRRILDHATVIDSFRPGPLNAFATLTSRPGILISLLVASSVPVTPPASSFEGFLIGAAPYLLLPPIVAVIAFVVPLTGAHARLSEQKERLQEEAELRLQGILADLNRDVDARDLAGADGLNKTLASLLIQRDILAKLPTWPWSTGTLRGFVSAILLPMALFLAQQALSRVF